MIFEKSYFELVENEPFQLKCEYDSFPLVSSVKWKRVSDSQLVSNNSILDFKMIKRVDAGVYECIVENKMIDHFQKRKVGQSSQKITLNVFFQPKMFNLITNKQAFSPLINLSCLVSSNPEPQMIWFKINDKTKTKIELNGVKYRISKSYKKRNDYVYESVLSILNANLNEDLGHYECESENRYGVNSLIIELVPEQVPEVPIDFRLVYTNYTQLTLAWSKNFDGGHEQTFELDVNQTRMNYSNLTQTVYNLTNLNKNTTYSIRLRATNKIGSSDWTSFLILNTLSLTNPNDMPKLENLTFYLNEEMNLVLLKYKIGNLIIGNDQELCLMVKIIDISNNYVNISDCIRLEMNENIVKINDVKISDNRFIPNLKASICLASNHGFCGEESNAIYGKSQSLFHYYFFIFLFQPFNR
jgi:hypothetical protein